MNHNQHNTRMMVGMMLACALPLLIVSVVPAFGRSPIISLVVVLGGMVVLHWLFMRPHRFHRASQDEPKAPPSEHATH